MGQVLIRNLDDALIADYKRAAAGHGRSLEAELREALAANRPRKRLSPTELIALSQSLREHTRNQVGSIEGWRLIREDRDR
ncbi:FitA-like ribbon-helix-helix domain-containing protein [Sphingomonas radiodurans]|uniref:FitA-like ribbon-helix-helix domain-containing protein n=1 Tax=Sphingomonas radiodurans TaxID=2890321 RepID=UPI0038CD3F34